jgi:hypothetical protein
MKNYLITFIKADPVKLTAEEAAELAMSWGNGAQVLMFNGRAIASHQICSIEPVSRQVEKDMCELEDVTKAPRLEDFLPTNQKQLR